MAVLPMHYIPDPVLRKKARKVRDLKDPELVTLVDDMIDSMYHYAGVGLAANQIGSLKRVCVIQMPDDEEPGWQARILRAEKVWARAVDLDGNPVRYKGVEDLLAQALEHEANHLDGVLYIDFLREKGDLYEVTPGDEEEGEGEDELEADAPEMDEEMDEEAAAAAAANDS
jgi:peptide deformylase